jgi:hypothetical protein
MDRRKNRARHNRRRDRPAFQQKQQPVRKQRIERHLLQHAKCEIRRHPRWKKQLPDRLPPAS